MSAAPTDAAVAQLTRKPGGTTYLPPQVRNKIKMFAQQKVTLPPGCHKIVILDEADRWVWPASCRCWSQRGAAM